MVLHLTQSFNQILAFVVKDPNGAQTHEVVFLLEKARRSLSVLKLFLDKTSTKEITQSAQIVLDAIRSVLDVLSRGAG